MLVVIESILSETELVFLEPALQVIDWGCVCAGYAPHMCMCVRVCVCLCMWDTVWQDGACLLRDNLQTHIEAYAG